jgi:cytochrome c-type biogenesis protein CcmF
MEINYIGEHLIPGYLGNFLLSLSFTTAIIATIAFALSVKQDEDTNGWQKIARSAFYIHAFAVTFVIATLFYIIINNYFEYYYAWHHANKELPFKYMFACFWEGQEGSFLLWSFWHVVLGIIVLRSKNKFTNPVMSVISSVQVFLTAMVLGIVLLDYKFGSNPFTLLREHPDMANLPFVKVPNYLENLDGRGLNPLLQNYWMTIHPPVLFLGFAASVIPFAYAIAGLWLKDFTNWIKYTLTWTVFGVMILGTGILMGGAWAYESLSFGGFWAWDPVENASLVPWIILVASLHLMLLHKARGGYLAITFTLTILQFVLVLYSTFLTRSGILGDTSVHAFTDLGMNGQLLVYLLFYLFGSFALLIFRYRKFEKNKQEEELWSREFWMFIASLVLCISAFQITFTTSIPVINKVLNLSKKIAPPTDPISHYNSWQLPFAIIIALIMAITQFFKYKKTDPKVFYKQIAWSTIFSLFIAIVVSVLWGFSKFYYSLFFFAAIYSVLANTEYWLSVLSGKIKSAGASISHIGFGLILVGVLISTSKKEIISQNTSGISVEQLGKDFRNSENIMLTKGDTLKMGDYYVTYQNKYRERVNLYHKINYLSKVNGSFVKEFTLEPIIQLNDKMGNVAEPATRHFLHKDVYTHITFADLEDQDTKPKEWNEKKYNALQIGDTVFTSTAIVTVEGINKEIKNKKELKLRENDIALSLNLKIRAMDGSVYTAEPVFVIRDNYIYPIEAKVEKLNLRFLFTKLDPVSGKVDLNVFDKPEAKKEFIVLKAIIFPGINVLWLGCLVMIVGSIIAIYSRIKNAKTV